MYMLLVAYVHAVYLVMGAVSRGPSGCFTRAQTFRLILAFIHSEDVS